MKVGRIVVELTAPFGPVGDTIECIPNSPISWEEHFKEGYENREAFESLKKGDILITPCSHTFFWRNGHAALVLDEEKGTTLEAAVLGENSCVQSIEKWRTYPSVTVLRVEALTEEEREELVQRAVNLVGDIPYSLLVGTGVSDTYQKTNCSHLVWAAYEALGYDLNCRGGYFVTPEEIRKSPCLTVVEEYGRKEKPNYSASLLIFFICSLIFASYPLPSGL